MGGCRGAINSDRQNTVVTTPYTVSSYVYPSAQLYEPVIRLVLTGPLGPLLLNDITPYHYTTYAVYCPRPAHQ